MTMEKYEPTGASLATEAPLPVHAILEQLRAIEELRDKVMKEGLHYAMLPGCNGQVLLQPGAEKLCLAVRLVTELAVHDLSNDRHAHYRVTCTVRSAVSGCVLGNAVAECSSGEEKYAWRKAHSQQEFDAAPPTASFRRSLTYTPTPATDSRTGA